MTTTVETRLPFDSLAPSLTGRLLLPGDPDYAALATPWNVAVVQEPVAVVEAATADDVVAAVRFAADHDLEVAVQSTGHGAVGFGPRTLLVQTGRLDELTIDPVGTARIGAGVRWGAVLAAGAPLGLGGLAGSAPNVGVVGYLTGGGIGPVARTFGVASDRVTGFEVVTGDGVLRRATAEENPALFWGLRGGKGALGIVTAVETDLVAIREVFGGCVWFDGADAAAVVHAWRAWTRGLPGQANSSVALVRLPPIPGVPEPLAGRLTVAVRFAWVGDPEQGRQVIAPMLGAGRIVFGGMDVLPYAALGAIHADPVDPMPTHEASTLIQELTPAAVDTLVALTGPESDCPQVIVELRHLGGAIARQPAHSSAARILDAEHNLLLIGLAAPPIEDATRAHAAAVLTAMQPWSNGACLPNFGASADPREIVRKYPPATLARLASLADSYDPRAVIAAAGPIRAAARIAATG